MAQKDWADVEQFYFLCSSKKDCDFFVQKLEGAEGISQLSNLIITLTSIKHDISLNDIIGQPASLLVHRSGEYYPHSGLITEFRYISSNPQYSTYKAVVSPLLWLLTLTKQSRVFQKKSIPDIIKEVLDANELSDYAQFHFKRKDFKIEEYVAQFEESDYNFISRLMEKCGIWYFFQEDRVSAGEINQKSINEKLIITDDPSQFQDLQPETCLKFLKNSGLEKTVDSAEVDTIYDLELCEYVVPARVTVKNYNYRTPEIDLTYTKQIEKGDVGLRYEYGGDFETITEAQNYAQVLSNRIEGNKIIISGKSSCRGIRPGLRIEVIEHKRECMNSTYVITEVNYSGKLSDKDKTGEMPHFLNEFKAIPAEYASCYVPEKTALETVIPGILNGRIEATGSEYASLDENGFYKVRMPYDMSDTDNYDCSKYIRMAQSYSGANYGMHFPLHEDTEVLVGHINQNPDNPIGLGTVPHSDTASPVNGNNRHNSIIRTAGGNEIVLDDTSGSQKMSISTPFDMSQTAGNNQKITVSNNRSINVGNNESAIISGDQKLTIDGNQTQAVKGDQCETIAGDYTLNIGADRDETFQASRKVEISGDSTQIVAGGQFISVAQSNSEKIAGNYSQKVAGNEVHSAQGPITIQADGNVEIKTGCQVNTEGISLVIQGNTSVKLQVAGNTVELTPGEVRINSSSDTLITGKLLDTLGGIITISGLPVNIN